MHDVGGLPNRVAMTSALKGEGVSYVTRSLAAVIAYDTDRSVVVVDTNWRRPDPMATEQPPAGLADAIEHGTPIDDIIVDDVEPAPQPRAGGRAARRAAPGDRQR